MPRNMGSRKQCFSTRRGSASLLRAGFLGLAGLGLGDVLRALGAGKPPRGQAPAKDMSVILVCWPAARVISTCGT